MCVFVKIPTFKKRTEVVKKKKKFIKEEESSLRVGLTRIPNGSVVIPSVQHWVGNTLLHPTQRTCPIEWFLNGEEGYII